MAACTRLPLQSAFHKNNYAFVRFLCTKPAVREPQYPPILPSLTAKSKSAKLRRLNEHFNQVKAADVQEKIRLLTRIQLMKYVVYPQTFAINADKWYQHLTKTAYIPGLPDKYSIIGESKEESSLPDTQNSNDAPSFIIDDSVYSDIREHVTNAILQEHFYKRRGRVFLRREQEHYVGPLLRNLVPWLTNTLAQHNPVLQHSSLDLDPQVNFYWLRGEWTFPRGHRKGRTEPVRFQVDDKPHSQIRIPQQLPEFAPLEAANTLDVPVITLSPDVLPLFKRQYDNNIFTGAKLPDPACYGHTQFHVVPDRYRRDLMAKRKLEDQIEVHLRANGIASLFSWTGAQAMYQGFWSHEDLTRPFVSQAVITDGRYFSFFCYQLNTLAIAVEVDGDNPRKNVLWGTESLPLYQAVQDGEVVGLDDGVLKLLIQFLMNGP